MTGCTVRRHEQLDTSPETIEQNCDLQFANTDGFKENYSIDVMRREQHCVGRRVIEMKVQGRRKRGRPKRRWLNRVRDDIKEKGLSYRPCYMEAYVIVHRPHMKVGIS